MPLIPQQDVIVIKGMSLDACHLKLMEKIAKYPDCRIVSISAVFLQPLSQTGLVAVIETV